MGELAIIILTAMVIWVIVRWALLPGAIDRIGNDVHRIADSLEKIAERMKSNEKL